MTPGNFLITGAALRPMPGAAAYCASKSALRTLARCAALEGAPLGVRVVALTPAGVRTEMWERQDWFRQRIAEVGRDAAFAELAEDTPPRPPRRAGRSGPRRIVPRLPRRHPHRRQAPRRSPPIPHSRRPRPVVDTMYGVGLTVIFDDPAGHHTDQPHPLHTQFIHRDQHLWASVRVDDVPV